MLLRPLWLAVQLLTILPTPPVAEPQPREIGRSALAYPLVGALLGALLAQGGRWLGAGEPLVTAALLLLGWVAVTGALHLDGLADSFDAWSGSHGHRERALLIMKDSRSGPMGVTAIVAVLLLKAAAVAALARHGQWQALAGVPLAARALLLALFVTTPYVRRDGLGATMAEHLPAAAGWSALSAAALVLIVLWGLPSFWLLLGLALFLLLYRWWLVHWLGGTTGDTAGALVELAEALLLAVLALRAAG